MKFLHALLCAIALLMLNPICGAQTDTKPENATAAVLRAFETHDIVMFGEIHGNKQEYEWLRALVSTPAFSDRVDDIVMETGNSLYQKSVDRYVSGEDVPLEQVQKAWRNVAGMVGPPSPVYASFYQAVREANLKRRGKHQMRIVCGDPYLDWDKVKNGEDIGPYLSHRDQWYAQVVKDEVLSKHHHALLIMGAGHFWRLNGPQFIERQLRSAGANPYVVVFGTNVTGGYDDLDHRFDSWPVPAIVSSDDSWVGELSARSVLGGGVPDPAIPAPLKLRDAADAMLYLGPRDSLTHVFMPRSELDGTPYGEETKRRLSIEGMAFNFIPEKDEAPQYSRPQTSGGGAQIFRAPIPKSADDPLPPRPPSQ